MRINVAVPEPHVSKPILDAALEGVTRLNQALIEQSHVPTFEQAMGTGRGVRWRPEPPGQEHFDHAGIVLGRGWGDCDDLAPWHAASLRATGEDPRARAVVKRSGPKRWHAIVQRSDGTFDDPSLDAGMPGPGRRGVNGAVLPVMFSSPAGVHGAYIARPQLALRPVMDRWGQPEAWQARTDLPWHWQPGKGPGDVAMVSLHASPVSDQALVGSIRGAARLGHVSGFADDEHVDRLCCIADALEGVDWEDLADEYGEEHADAADAIVVGIFGGLGKAISRAAKSVARSALPIAQQALPYVPGVGPAAATALKAASPILKKALAKKVKRSAALKQAYQHGRGRGAGQPMICHPMPFK